MKQLLPKWALLVIAGFAMLLSTQKAMAQSAVVTLRPAQLEITSITSESAVLMTLSGYSQDDARYRLYNGTTQYNCWDEATDMYVTANSYASGPQVPGTPTTSTTFWVLYEIGTNPTTAASYRDRLGPAYASPNYQTVALPAATAIAAPQTITKSDVPFAVWSDFSVKYVALGFDAVSGGNLIAAAPTALTNGDFNMIIETGTVIRRIEIRSVMNSTIETVTGTWPSGITVLPPTNFAATTVNNTQINLGWTLNASNNNVLLAWSTDGIFGNPTGSYTVGGTISGGGTVLLAGNGTSYNHTSLNPGTIYYYKIWSTDGSDYSPGVADNATTEPDPATTTLPYMEDFSVSLGDCYPVSVSGDTKQWVQSSGGYAYMNGYNTGELEEDWLILPGINFNENFNALLTFESFMNYGSDDADNYFKLLYSSNYAGIGDPTSATWSELTFNYPTELSTWTPSGNVDLSALTGTNVYIAFKYHYNAGFYRSWQIDNISIVAGDSPSLTATPSTLNGFTYEVGNGPSAAQTYQLSATNLVGSGNLAVTAPTDYEISLNGTSFSNTLNIAFASGEITGQPITVHARLKAGLAIGTYNEEQILHTGGGITNAAVTCNGSVTELLPVITSETVPAYIQGINGTNAQRVPFAFSLTLSNLMPSTTYRYYNKVVIGTDTPTSNGAGNSIFVNSDGTFTRTSSTSFGNPGEYGEFTTDASGIFSGWFITEPSGNARFTPQNEVFMRIMLNDGAEGTSVVNRLTTTSSVTVINFGNVNQAGEGTAIRGLSEATSGNLVYLFDNVDGNGRPVYGSSIETTGVDFTAIGSYANFYKNDVQGNNGSWGGIVPNLLPDGIRRVEERSSTDGSIVAVQTSEDGVWGVYDTRNPFGGETDVLIINLLPTGEPLLTVSPAILSGFSYVEGAGPSAIQTYALSGTDLEGSGNIAVTAPVDYEVSSDGTTFADMIEYPFAEGIITGQPVTVSVRLKADLPIGDYNGETIVNSGGGATDKMVTLNGSVTTMLVPGLTNVTLPQFIEGLNGSNNFRVPFAYRATIENLMPNSTYRFFNKMALESDLPDYNGAGNCIFVAADGTFTRTSSTSLENPGGFGEFTTDVAGTYTGWFINEPTSNDRFTPGNQIYPRIVLNDGNEGTTGMYWLTTEDYATVLQFGTEASDTQGTAIRGISEDSPKDFVYLYDNIEGTGRPLYGAHIEASGVDFASITSYAPFYLSEVAGVNGRWGGIVPNMNDAGVQRVEVRSLQDGSIANEYIVPSGIWILTDTRNPMGGADNVLVLDLVSIGIENPAEEGFNIFSTGSEITVLTTLTGTHNFSLMNLQGQVVYQRQLSGSTNYKVVLNIPTGIYIARLSNSTGFATQKLMIK